MSQAKIKLPKTQLTAFCQRWRISELAMASSDNRTILAEAGWLKLTK